MNMKLSYKSNKHYIAMAIVSVISTSLLTLKYSQIENRIFINRQYFRVVPTVNRYSYTADKCIHNLTEYLPCLHITEKQDIFSKRCADTRLAITEKQDNSSKRCSDTRCAITACDIRITGYDSSSLHKNASIEINGRLAFNIHDLPGFYLTKLAGNCSLLEVYRFSIDNDTSLMNYLTLAQHGTTVAGVSGGGYKPGPYGHKIMNSLGLLGDNKIQFNKKGILLFVGRIGFPRFTITKWAEGKTVIHEICRYHIGIEMSPSMVPHAWEELSRIHQIKVGGAYHPPHCDPRYKIAIVIPFRDREEHLKVFINHIIPFLKAQMLAFTIYVIDQEQPELFNRAMLMNIGYVEASKISNYDCFVFHDVDLLPQDLCNSYYCSTNPRHLVVSYSKKDYRKIYKGQFGGANIFSPIHMNMTNGFSNRFFGWGGEDDEAYRRFKNLNMNILRQPPIIGRYQSILHKRDSGNQRSGISMTKAYTNAKYYKVDGLSTLEYTRINLTFEALFTRIRVRIPGPLSMKDLKQYTDIIGRN